MPKPLDPILHNQLRLSIMSVLMQVKSADFSSLLDTTESSKGNLSTQLKKLDEVGYISIKKSFKNNYPHTQVQITTKGRKAFEQYFDDIKTYYKNN